MSDEPTAPPVGPHVSRSGKKSIAKCIEAARSAALREAGFAVAAAAIFVGGPMQKRILLGEADGAELREYLGRTGIRVFAHSAYVAVPWKGDAASAAFIREELQTCARAGIEGLVTHLPKSGADSVLACVGDLFPAGDGGGSGDTPTRLYLETPALVDSPYGDPEALGDLFRRIREKVGGGVGGYGSVLPRSMAPVGLCFDTAHLWVNGVDLSTYEAAAAWVAQLEEQADIPPEHVMGHLNDSARPRGSGPDEHAPLMRGEMWRGLGPRESGLAAFTDYALRHGTPLILERGGDAAGLLGDYRVLRDLLSM